MKNFELDVLFFIVLLLGIWFTISSIVGLYNDIKEKEETKWWKWILDPIGLIVGVGFLCELILIL